MILITKIIHILCVKRYIFINIIVLKLVNILSKVKEIFISTIYKNWIIKKKNIVNELFLILNSTDMDIFLFYYETNLITSIIRVLIRNCYFIDEKVHIYIYQILSVIEFGKPL